MGNQARCFGDFGQSVFALDQIVRSWQGRKRIIGVGAVGHNPGRGLNHRR